jgi:hypothetical protein
MRLLPVEATAAVLLILAACGSDSTGPSQNPEGWNEYTQDDVTFEWLVVDSTSTLEARVTAPTTGWVAVGFDPQTAMLEANLIIGYVAGGTASVRDDYGTDQFGHASDTSLGGVDNVSEASGSESSGETMIEFTIPMDSGDQYDKALTEGTTYTVVFAYGADGADDFTSQHVYAAAAALEI